MNKQLSERIVNEIEFVVRNEGYGELINSDNYLDKIKSYSTRGKKTPLILTNDDLNIDYEEDEPYQPNFIFLYTDLEPESLEDKDLHEKFQECCKNISSKKHEDANVNYPILLFFLTDSLISLIRYKEKDSVFYKQLVGLAKEEGIPMTKKTLLIDYRNLTFYVGGPSKKPFVVNVKDRLGLQACPNKQLDGKVYTAKLKDIVEIYRETGDELFEKNIRLRIGDEFDVDRSIKNTLKSCPSDFWYLNNGITAIVSNNCITSPTFENLCLSRAGKKPPIQIVNGAQTVTSSSEYFYSSCVSDLAEDEAYVMLRLINPNIKGEKEDEIEDEVDKITISLNRQKPISIDDLAFVQYPIAGLNELYVDIKENDELFDYVFCIMRRGDSESVNNKYYNLESLARALSIIHLNSPGKARSSGKKTLLALKSIDGNNEYPFKLDILPGTEGDYDRDKIKETFSKKYKAISFLMTLICEVEKLQQIIMKDKKIDKEVHVFVSYSKYLVPYCLMYSVLDNKKELKDIFQDNDLSKVDYSNWKYTLKDAEKIFGENEKTKVKTFTDIGVMLEKNWKPDLTGKKYDKYDSNAFKLDGSIRELAKIVSSELFSKIYI